MKSLCVSFLFLILAMGSLHANYYGEGEQSSEDSDWGETVAP